MNGCHHCVLLIVADERLEMRIYSAADGAFPKIAAANRPTFLYNILTNVQIYKYTNTNIHKYKNISKYIQLRTAPSQK